MNIKKHIPNLITLINLFCGCIAVVFISEANYEMAFYMVCLGIFFDFFDGFFARLFKVSSPLGLQLDSLADMVSFGLLPGLTLYAALEPFGKMFLGTELPFEIKYLGLFVTLFSCLRLAIFNLDEDQKYYFKGLNTPSNTILIFGLYYAFKENQSFEFLMNNEVLLIIFTLLCSWLLISPIKMIAMKFKSMKLQDNYPKLALLIGSVIILIIFKTVGIPMVIIYYILISILFQKQLN